MDGFTRRALIQKGMQIGPCLALSLWTAACRRVIEVERVVQVEREVTKIVREVVRETVLVEDTPRIIVMTPRVIEKEVEKVVTAQPAPQGEVTLVVDALDYGWTRYAMELTPAFAEVFPSVRVRWRTLSDWRGYADRIAALHASGEGPDLVQAPPGTLPAAWLLDGLIRPLDDLMATGGFDTAGIFQAALDAYRFQDQWVGLPFLAHPGANLLVFNASLWDAYNIPHPTAQWTLEDLSEAAQRLQVQAPQGERVYGWVEDLRLPEAYPLLYLFGGWLLSRDGRRCLAQGEGALACLSWGYAQIHLLGVAPRPREIARSATAMFRSRRLGALRLSLLPTMALLNAEGGDDLDVSIYPVHAGGGRFASALAAMGYCIGAESKSPNEALQWIKYISAREAGIQMFLRGYAEPGCRLASWRDARVLERFPLCGQMAEITDSAPSERLPWNLQMVACLQAWNAATRQLVSGALAPDEAAGAICSAIEAILAQPLPDQPPDAAP
ncbi:MAG: extracellular solute-binding protein [Anaerolineae bacterium]|nr:extracellular solute-binding protein [Anaerolineae bacterium]